MDTKCNQHRSPLQTAAALALVALLGGAYPLSVSAAASPEAMQQANSIHGKVLDNTGEPVIGATVRVVGTKTATITDLDGNFTLPGS